MTCSNTTIHIPENILFRQVGDEAVVVNLERRKDYSLNPMVSRMWTLLAEHGQIEPVIQILLEEFEVEPERLRGDLLELVEALARLGLLEASET